MPKSLPAEGSDRQGKLVERNRHAPSHRLLDRKLPRGPAGTRHFEALGGYPTRGQAEAALADALTRRSHGLTLHPAKLTVNQYLDRWLAHIQTTLRARTVARYRTLLAHHVRPHVGAQLLKGTWASG